MSDAEHEHLNESMRLVARLTLDALKPLPLQSQLMACDGLAHLLKGKCPAEANAAAQTAEHLRRAEAAQTVMRELLTP